MNCPRLSHRSPVPATHRHVTTLLSGKRIVEALCRDHAVAAFEGLRDKPQSGSGEVEELRS